MQREYKMDNTLYVKNMVCPRCIKVVREELEKLGIEVQRIELGKVRVGQDVNELNLDEIKIVLEKEGFELIEDTKTKLIDGIKTEIISVIQKYKDEDLEKVNFSQYLSEIFNKDYNYLSNLFSKTEGITIEHYIILQKIEKAKELLKYGEMTLSEIAYRLGYSSVQHLSRQFKQITGFTASKFKDDLTNLRKPLDSIK